MNGYIAWFPENAQVLFLRQWKPTPQTSKMGELPPSRFADPMRQPAKYTPPLRWGWGGRGFMVVLNINKLTGNSRSSRLGLDGPVRPTCVTLWSGLDFCPRCWP